MTCDINIDKDCTFKRINRMKRAQKLYEVAVQADKNYETALRQQYGDNKQRYDTSGHNQSTMAAYQGKVLSDALWLDAMGA